jgi:uncharacterized protein (DUF1697 family)
MPKTRYVALLRGINVGGNNIIAKSRLVEIFESAGLEHVSTYIQSGNVLFETSRARGRLEPHIEAALERALGVDITVVVVSHDELEKIVSMAPRGFGKDPKRFRYDVIFLKKPLKAVDAIEQVPTKEGVDDVVAGDGVLYLSRLDARATQSRISRLVALPIYKSMTIRNWNTTTKLLALLDARISTK